MREKGYMLRIIRHASFQKLKFALCASHERSSKSKAFILADMANCTVRYGSGYYDYLIFAFYNLTASQRKTYVTRLFNKRFTEFMNSEDYMHIFDNKDEFYEKFKNYLGRDFIILKNSTDEQIENFVQNKDRFFAKICHGECGRGCAVINASDFSSKRELINYLKENFDIAEQIIIQHHLLSEFYPNAVNSMRIITAIDRYKEPHILYAVQKFGMGTKVVDNNSLFAPVDLTTGKIAFHAHSGDTVKGQVYEIHPNSAKRISGFEVPFATQAANLCLKAAKEVPQMRYIGWDVAITENGPVIIEGNNFSAHDFWQLPVHTPQKIGMIPKIKEIVPEFFEREGKKWN